MNNNERIIILIFVPNFKKWRSKWFEKDFFCVSIFVSNSISGLSALFWCQFSKKNILIWSKQSTKYSI